MSGRVRVRVFGTADGGGAAAGLAGVPLPRLGMMVARVTRGALPRSRQGGPVARVLLLTREVVW